MEKIPSVPSGSVILQNVPSSWYNNTDLLAMERPMALTSGDLAALNMGSAPAAAALPPLYGRLVGGDPDHQLVTMSTSANINAPYPKPQYQNNDTGASLLAMPLQATAGGGMISTMAKSHVM